MIWDLRKLIFNVTLIRLILVGLVLIEGSTLAETFGVYRSVDRAESWSKSDAGLEGAGRINAFGVAGDLVFAGADHGIFVLRDGDQIWRKTAGAATNSVRVVAIASVGGVVFAGVEREGMLVSEDRGANWFKATNFPSKRVRSALSADGAVYMGTDSDGVFRSSDRGKSWTRLFDGLPDGAQVFALTAAKGKIFAGLYSKGLFSLEPRGARWTQVQGVVPLALASVADGLIAGHNPGGVFMSEDCGEIWSKAEPTTEVERLGVGLPATIKGPGSDDPVWEMAAGDGLAVAGVGDGIYFSADKGRMWTRAQKGLPANTPGVAFLVTEKAIFAATSGR